MIKRSDDTRAATPKAVEDAYALLAMLRLQGFEKHAIDFTDVHRFSLESFAQ